MNPTNPPAEVRPAPGVDLSHFAGPTHDDPRTASELLADADAFIARREARRIADANFAAAMAKIDASLAEYYRQFGGRSPSDPAPDDDGYFHVTREDIDRKPAPASDNVSPMGENDAPTPGAIAEAEWAGFMIGANGQDASAPAHYSPAEVEAFHRGHRAGSDAYYEACAAETEADEEARVWAAEREAERSLARVNFYEAVEAGGVDFARHVV